MSDNGNGHNTDNDISVAEIIKSTVEEARNKNGGSKIANRAFSAIENNQLGVLPTIMRAIKDIGEYRQELKTANWIDRAEAMKAVAAIHECVMCGVDISPIVDRIIAESAGVASARLELVIRGLTHTEFNLNQNGFTGKQHWWNRKPNNQPTSQGAQGLMN